LAAAGAAEPNDAIGAVGALQLLKSDHPRTRRAHRRHGRVGRPPLLGYLAGAGALAVILAAGLVALDPAGRDQALGIEKRPSPAATPQPARAAASAPASPALMPAIPAPAALAAPAQPASAAPAGEATSERLPQFSAATGSPLPQAATPRPADRPAGSGDRAEPGETAAISLPSVGTDPVRAAPQASPGRGSLIQSAAAPLQCFSSEVRAVLAGLAKAAGDVEILSTTELHTDNHSPGSIRAELHKACKAVDLRVRGPIADATAFLRGRGEVASIQPYRNGVIHIDFRDGARTASAPGSRPSRRMRAARSAEAAPAEAVSQPPAAPPSLFAPAPRPDIVR
jgi:hypothetical protein